MQGVLVAALDAAVDQVIMRQHERMEQFQNRRAIPHLVRSAFATGENAIARQAEARADALTPLQGEGGKMVEKVSKPSVGREPAASALQEIP